MSLQVMRERTIVNCTFHLLDLAFLKLFPFHIFTLQLDETLWHFLNHPNLQAHIELASSPSHDFLPDCDITGVPWEEVAVGLIGTWLAPTPHSKIEFLSLTWISTMNTITNLIVFFWVFNITIDYAASKFEHTWLAHCPLSI